MMLTADTAIARPSLAKCQRTKNMDFTMIEKISRHQGGAGIALS